MRHSAPSLRRRRCRKSTKTVSVQTVNAEHPEQSDRVTEAVEPQNMTPSRGSAHSNSSKLKSSAELDIQRMTESVGQEDTVNIESLDSLCDDVLQHWRCTTPRERPSDSEQVHMILEDLIDRAVAAATTRAKQPADNVLPVVVERVSSNQSPTRPDIIEETVHSEAKVIRHPMDWSVEEGVNQHALERQHPTVGMVQSPLSEKYSQSLQRLRESIKAFTAPEAAVKAHSLSSATSTSASFVSSIDWSSIDVAHSIWSGVTGVSLSESSSFGDDVSQSVLESTDYELLKESLNRRWDDIQCALRSQRR